MPFVTGVDASQVKPHQITYVKQKQLLRSHATNAEKRLLSLLPIQVTPTDSSIVPPAPVKSQELDGADDLGYKRGDGRNGRKPLSRELQQSHQTHHEKNRPHHEENRPRNIENRPHLEENRPHNEDYRPHLEDNRGRLNRGTNEIKYRRINKRILAKGSQSRSSQHLLNHNNKYVPGDSRPFKPKDIPKINYVNNMNNRQDRYPEGRQAQYRPPLERDRSVEEIVRDKSKETQAKLDSSKTSTDSSHPSTKQPYTPTENVLAKEDGLMQINVYDEIESDAHLLDLLESNESVEKKLSKEVTALVPYNKPDNELINSRQASVEDITTVNPSLSHKNIDKGIIVTTEHQGQPLVTSTQMTETPEDNVNKTEDKALPWNSVVASQVKHDQVEEESATGNGLAKFILTDMQLAALNLHSCSVNNQTSISGGIVGGAAGCILVVLAFVVLAIFWRR